MECGFNPRAINREGGGSFFVQIETGASASQQPWGGVYHEQVLWLMTVSLVQLVSIVRRHHLLAKLGLW